MRNKALDGVRGAAIILVLADHLAPNILVHNLGEWGRMGLLLFFILSGYLITNILLDYDDEIKRERSTVSRALKVFYSRRALRILPVYFLAVLLIAMTVSMSRFNLFSHIFFFQNITAAFLPVGHFGAAYPLWSLAVEEQFYILWAPVILFCSPGTRIKVGLLMIALAFCFKAYAAFNGESLWFVRLITFGNLEGLAIGAFTAMGQRDERAASFMGKIFRIAAIIGPLMVIYVGVITYAKGYVSIRSNPYYMVFFDLTVLASLWALMYSALIPNRLNRFLRIQPLPFIGVISYSLYIWHEFVRMFAPMIFRSLFNINLLNKYSFFSLLVFGAVALVISFLSWRFIEIPFNRLKNRYTLYAEAKKAEIVAASSPSKES